MYNNIFLENISKKNEIFEKSIFVIKIIHRCMSKQPSRTTHDLCHFINLIWCIILF